MELGFKGADLERLRFHLSLARQLNAATLRVVITDSDWRPSVERQVAVLTTLLPELADSGIILALENHFFCEPRELAEVVRLVADTHVRVCLDTLNSMSLLVGPRETADTLGSLAATVHVKDGVMQEHKTSYHHCTAYRAGPCDKKRLNEMSKPYMGT